MRTRVDRQSTRINATQNNRGDGAKRTTKHLIWGALIATFLLSLVFLSTGHALATGGTGSGAISLTTLGSPYSQNFDSLSNTSGTTNTLTVNGWYIYEVGTGAKADGKYGVDTGGSTAGDTYSYGSTASSDRALGTLLSGSVAPTIGASFTNNTGNTVNRLAISYTGEQWRAGATGRNAADRLDFQLSTDAISLTTGTWTDYDNLDFNSPNISTTLGALNGNLVGNRTPISYTITGLNIANGSGFWIRWTDFNIASSDDGLAVDDFSLTPIFATAPTGVGTATPSVVDQGGTTLLKVTVTPGTNPTSTGITVTGNLSSIGGSATQAFYDDGTHGDQTAADNVFSFQATVAAATPNGAKTLPITIGDAQSRTGSASISLTVAIPNVAIHTIQGASHTSPMNGQVVSTVPSIVLAKTSNGFYMQDPNPDSNPATSEGIFVFTSSAPTVNVGDKVVVSGRVSEFRPGGSSTANLTTTELSVLALKVVSSGNPLPAPVIIGNGGRLPPSTVIEDDATGSVETSGVFDPATDGIDFYESLEGMYVQVNNALVVGPTHDFGSNREVYIVADSGAHASLRTSRGGLVIRPGDFNPERIVLNDLIAGGPILPAVNVRDQFSGATRGVMDYNFGNFKLEVTQLPPAVSGGLTQETMGAAGANQLAIATFNVENLAPSDPASKFSQLAKLIVTNLRAPDIVAVEEIQDNNGVTDDGVVDANITWGMLISAIQAAGGPTYQYRQINPVNDQDGGAPGGNIRQGFLFRTDRGLAFVDHPGGDSTSPTGVTGSGASTALTFSPGRIDPTNPAFNDSRKPLAGEFTFKGNKVFVIANHFNSKGGDQPLFGRFQPPTFSSETQRIQQATIVNGFVQSILSHDANAYVVVLGDLNDFQFSNPITTLKGTVLKDLIETLPEKERYTYDFEGNSETLDHILISNALFNRPYVYKVVHVNSEFAAQASDHEPQEVHLNMAKPSK